MSLESTEELCLIARKIDTKFEGKLICASKNDMRNLANFHQSTWKSQNWYFDGIPLSKLESAWAWKLQRSYMSWQWRMMQNLKRNWLVILKIDMRNLMNFDSGTPLTKVYNVWAMFLLCLMALNIDAKFEGKLTCPSEMTWGIWQIFKGWKIAISF